MGGLKRAMRRLKKHGSPFPVEKCDANRHLMPRKLRAPVDANL